MSQHDFDITTADANTGITFRASINDALQALASISSGSTPPAMVYPYMFWVDTSTSSPSLRQRNVANTAWIHKGRIDEEYNGVLPLTVTKTGTWRFVPAILLQAAGAIQLLDSSVINPSGKWVSAISYVESNSTYGKEITTLRFDDLGGVIGTVAITSCMLMTSLEFTSLINVGGIFAQTNLPALTTLATPELQNIAGACNQASLTLLQTISFPKLTTLGSTFSPATLPQLHTLNIPLLSTINSHFTLTDIPLLTTISAPALVSIAGNFSTSSMLGLTSINFPELQFVGGNFQPSSAANLTSVSVPKLDLVGGSFNITNDDFLIVLTLTKLRMVVGAISMTNVLALTTLNFPALTTITDFNVVGMGALGTISLPVIDSILGYFSMTSSTAGVTSITLGASLKKVGGNFTITSAALTQASVDGILARLAALNGSNGTTAYSSKAITITGTSATPSAAGLASKATLVARGCTVTHN